MRPESRDPGYLWDALRAARIALDQPADSLKILLANVPLDDEPDDDDFDGGLTEARSGQSISHEELLRRLGIGE